jgi:hypothetical protein
MMKNQQLWVGSNDKGIFKVDLSNRIKFVLPFWIERTTNLQEIYNDANNTTWMGQRIIFSLQGFRTYNIR